MKPALATRHIPRRPWSSLEPLEARIAPAALVRFIDPHPSAGNLFGAQILPLSTGNVVVTAPGDDTGGTDVGAVYLFDGTTGGLISELHGSTAFDQVGGDGVTAVGNGNFVVRSPVWDNGAVLNAGAVTWGSGVTGVSGVVSESNSLVGSHSNDQVGSVNLSVLSNGNYVVRTANWSNGVTFLVGAYTWGDGATGVSGVVSESNSLVGSAVGDTGRLVIIELDNGNYLMRSPTWDNGVETDAGAVTWGSGTAGVNGVISATNSLVGSTADDEMGQTANEVTVLSNGNYLVRNPRWDNGAETDAGAVTWGSGEGGVSGVVSASNSLVGSTANDGVGSSAPIELSNGNYLVRSPDWDNGAVMNAGAVTWGSGTLGVSGVIGASNSLIGSTANDGVGLNGVIELSNGNYVVRSLSWDTDTATDAGAVTWGSGTLGVSGVVGAGNSLVGSLQNDLVGRDGVTALSNGHYVVSSSGWDNGAVGGVGAVTWGNGETGTIGAVSESNSLIGTVDDAVGVGGVIALSNGNYVVRSYFWNNGAARRVGAVTWVDGAAGVSAVVGVGNSLIGSTADDQVGEGDVTVLANGNYVVRSPHWDNNAATDAGAMTWGSGETGVIGEVGAGNSLLGSTTDDQVGSGGVVQLSGGDYVVISLAWDNGPATDAGAVTWGSGTAGVRGEVGESNSLVGSSTNDAVGNQGVKMLANGNYVVPTRFWDNGADADAGAVTWGSGTAGVRGAISESNSLIGASTNDHVGNRGVTELANGNYLVGSSEWNNGAATRAGALTWGSGVAGVSGVVSAGNSLVGSTAEDSVGSSTVTTLTNGNYLLPSPVWDNGAAVDAGAVTWGSGTVGVSGVVSATNSLVGSTALDNVGSGGLVVLSGGNYVVLSPQWDNGALANVRAITWGHGATGISGVVSAANSFLGSTADVQPVRVLSNDGAGTFIVRLGTEFGFGYQASGFPNVVPLDAKTPFTFFDANHDKVTVRLTGAGTGTLVLNGGVLDNANVAFINLLNTTAKSALAVTIVKDKLLGDGLTQVGAVTVAGALGGFSGAAVDFIGGGFHATGPVNAITAHALLAGHLFTGGVAADKLALTFGGDLGVAGSAFKLQTPQSITALKAASIGLESIEAAAFGSINVFDGALDSEVTSAGAIGSVKVYGGDLSGVLTATSFGAISVAGGDLSGDLTAASFGAISVAGDHFSGKITSTTPLATLGQTKALASLTMTGGDFRGDISLVGAIGPITIKAGSLNGEVEAGSFGAVSITGGGFHGELVATTPAAMLGAARGLASLTVTGGDADGRVLIAAAGVGTITVKGGELCGRITATSFGAVSVTGGPFETILTATAIPVGAAKALASLTITGGDMAGSVSLLGASGPITVKGGDWFGGVDGVSFGAISITGGDFRGLVNSNAPAGTLGATKALASFTVTDGNFTGKIRLLGTSGAITVKSSPALAAGNMIGASVVAKAIASLTVGRNFTDSIVLAGADLGFDFSFGGGDDTFAAGTIGAVKIGNRVTGISVIGAGFSNVDGDLHSADDKILGAATSSIASLTITGTAAPGSYFAAGVFKTVPTIAGSVIMPAVDGRFLVG